MSIIQAVGAAGVGSVHSVEAQLAGDGGARLLAVAVGAAAVALLLALVIVLGRRRAARMDRSMHAD